MLDADQRLRHQHFLERAAERTDGAELEFALQLYEDPALLTGVLAAATLPPGDGRIALGLDLQNDGPWLVVTRDAQFVTCLGRGMVPTGTHPLPATQVASLVVRVLKQRHREAVAEQRVPQSRQTQFLQRLFKRGADMTREDVQVLVAWLPVMADTYGCQIGPWLEFCFEMFGTADVWLTMPVKRCEKSLEAMHESFWGCTIAYTVLAETGKDHGWLGNKPVSIPYLLTSGGVMGATLRAAWAVGRIGKPLLPAFKQAFREAQAFEDYLTAVYGLLTMAMRHRSLRAEILKLILAKQPETKWPDGMAEIHAPLVEVMTKTIEHHEGAVKFHLEMGRTHVHRLCAILGGELAKRYPDPDSVPESIAHASATMMNGDCKQSDYLPFMIASCIWLAQADLDDLYLPKSFMDHWVVPWRPDHSYALLRQHRPGGPPQGTVRAEAKPGRNERCPCGSGRKYKVCCGRG